MADVEGSIQSDPLPTRQAGGTTSREQQEGEVGPQAADQTDGRGRLDPLLDRSFDLPPRFQRQRRRPRYVAGKASTTTDDIRFQNEEDADESTSFAQNALNGTFGLLRQVGGATLSTTGALVAPPLHVTRRVLLPQLWAIAMDVWEGNAPQRLKDWCKIVQSSIYHILYTLRDTSAGHAVRRKWLVVWQDLLDILSTDLTQQALIDTVGTIVKFSEALTTDQANAFFDQMAIAMNRILEVLSNPRCRLLLYDWRHAIASVATLLADPVATTALAEVTAYLCYALEREQGKIPSHRQRRHQYQVSMNQRDTINKHPTMTVEEAILSSLDPAPLVDTADESTNDGVQWDTASSIRQQVEAEKDDWLDTARRHVDVQFLREMVEERAMEQHSSKAMEDLGGFKDTIEPAPKRSRVQVETVHEDDCREDNVVTFTTNNEDSPSPKKKERRLRLDGESPMDQFERILDDILEERRKGNISESRKNTADENETLVKPLQSRKSKSNPVGGRLPMLLGVGLVLGIGTLWFGFGCFGVYLYWLHYYHAPKFPARSATTEHEVVVRVVKEVVHVDAKGNVLGRGMQGWSSMGDEIEKVASCVADAYKN